jgi:hypothetical protein
MLVPTTAFVMKMQDQHPTMGFAQMAKATVGASTPSV